MRKCYNILLLLIFLTPVSATALDTIAQPQIATVQDSTALQSTKHFDENFREKYKGGEFNYDRKEASKKLSKFQQFLRWLSHALSSDEQKEGEGLSLSQIITRVAAVIIILLVIYFIARSLLKKEGYWIFGRPRKVINTRDLGLHDIETTDFRSLIDATVQQQDYRLGIRYQYLWLLKLMASANVIKWHKDKTHTDYLYEIKDEKLRKEFRYLSYLYDYSWYGEFTVNQDDYVKAEKAFTDTIKKLGQ